MVPKETAQRVREYRDRMRAAGFKLLHLWAHPDDAKQLRDYAKYLQDKRANDAAPEEDSV